MKSPASEVRRLAFAREVAHGENRLPGPSGLGHTILNSCCLDDRNWSRYPQPGCIPSSPVLFASMRPWILGMGGRGTARAWSPCRLSVGAEWAVGFSLWCLKLSYST